MTIEETEKILKESFKKNIETGHSIGSAATMISRALTYPEKNHIFRDKVENEFVGTHAQYLEKIAEAEKLDKDNYDNLLSDYHKLDNFIDYLFCKYLAEDCGYKVDSPEWKVIYSRAYEKGHPEGYESVALSANDICDFISEYENAKIKK